MLSITGFEDIELRGDWTDKDPTPDTTTVVFLARKPAAGEAWEEAIDKLERIVIPLGNGPVGKLAYPAGHLGFSSPAVCSTSASRTTEAPPFANSSPSVSELRAYNLFPSGQITGTLLSGTWAFGVTENRWRLV